MFVKTGRRVPAQERSKQRVERILDAAAQVFAEDGYDAATMEKIAERAETSIGSIYQFFPNKLAVFSALARRYHETLRRFFDELLEGPLLERPWPEVLDASIDAMTAWSENDPAYRAVWKGLAFTSQVIEEGEAINKEFAERLRTILAKKLPNLPAQKRPVVATMIVEILSAMMITGARRSPKEAKQLMTETKTLLRRYLEPFEAQGTR